MRSLALIEFSTARSSGSFATPPSDEDPGRSPTPLTGVISEGFVDDDPVSKDPAVRRNVRRESIERKREQLTEARGYRLRCVLTDSILGAVDHVLGVTLPKRVVRMAGIST